jgi:hypothetical protein
VDPIWLNVDHGNLLACGCNLPQPYHANLMSCRVLKHIFRSGYWLILDMRMR